MVSPTYPGVYIEEFTPGAPIQGIGTSTAAFIGVCATGTPKQPVMLTSFDAFTATFGNQPVPGYFLWYAVHGFFKNGGQVCYVVRASNGAYDLTTLYDQNTPGQPTITVQATQLGVSNPQIWVSVQADSLVPATNAYLFQYEAAVESISFPQTVVLPTPSPLTSGSDAAAFRPGDWLYLGPLAPRVQLARVIGNTLRLVNPLPAGLPTPATVRLADVAAGDQTVRIQWIGPVLAPGSLVSGTTLTISPLGSPPSNLPQTQVVQSVQVEQLQTSPPITTYRVTFRQGLSSAVSMTPVTSTSQSTGQCSTIPVQSEEFDLIVYQGSAITTYPTLAMDPVHPRYYPNIVNGSSGPVILLPVTPPPTTPLAYSLPAPFPAPTTPPSPIPAPGTPLVGGAAETLPLADSDFIDALDTLQQLSDVDLVAVPDSTTPAVQQAVIAQCELLADRFGVLDSQPGIGPFATPSAPNSVEVQRQGLDSAGGYAALYYPWLSVLPNVGNGTILVPPSGHVCGIIANTDITRGVYKAPAGINAIVLDSVGLQRRLSDVDQGQLNPLGINVLRVFQTGGQPVVWGARTTSTDTNWQYVNIRRLFIFLEGSIKAGIRWAVFEPNNSALWQKLIRSITDFLTSVQRDGGIYGTKPADGFYVRIDDALNPFSEQALGRLHIEIGIRPTYPAEFIMVRIGIWPGGSSITEG